MVFPEDKILGQKFRHYRGLMDLKQGQLVDGDVIKSQQEVHRLERGTKHFTQRIKDTIVAAFEKSLEKFIMKHGDVFGMNAFDFKAIFNSPLPVKEDLELIKILREIIEVRNSIFETEKEELKRDYEIRLQALIALHRDRPDQGKL